MENIHQILDIVSWVCLAGGALICIVGGVGLIRLPDFYCRTHGASITDTPVRASRAAVFSVVRLHV